MTYPADNRRNDTSCGPLKKIEDALEANDSQRSGSECRLMEAWGTMSGVNGSGGLQAPGRTSAWRILKIGLLASIKDTLRYRGVVREANGESGGLRWNDVRLLEDPLRAV
jgi:hypothetical protein